MNKTKIFIVGSSGMLGTELSGIIAKSDEFELCTSDISDANGIDITDEQSIRNHISENNPDVVINCAAFTNVDACEEEDGYAIAEKVNGFGPGLLAKVCKEQNVVLVHISTESVFGDNKVDGYMEDYQPYNPLNGYGKSKVVGEEQVAEVMGGIEGSDFDNQNPKMYIVRTSWLFGPGATNFLAKIIKYAKERDHLDVVTDEDSSPTYILDLAERILELVKNDYKGGIYHITGNGHCTRNEFAKEILKHAGISTPVNETTHEQFERKTKIAKIGFLVNTKLPPMRDWQLMVEDFIKNRFQEE